MHGTVTRAIPKTSSNLRRVLVTPRVQHRLPAKSRASTMAVQGASEGSFWDGIVSVYQLFTPIASHYNGVAFEHVKPRLLTGSPFVLDLACGNGSFALEAARALPNATVLGVDVSENQISGAQAKVQQANLSNVEFKVMDGKDLQLADESVDAIVCMFGLMYFGDQDKSWREMYRVLKPGGIVVVGTWNEPPFIDFYEAANAKVRGLEQVVELPSFDESRNLRDPEQLRKQALAAAPFSKVETSIEDVMWKPWPIEETRTGTEKMLATSIFSPPADVDAEQFTDAMAQLITDAANGADTAALPCRATVAVAHK